MPLANQLTLVGKSAGEASYGQPTYRQRDNSALLGRGGPAQKSMFGIVPLRPLPV